MKGAKTMGVKASTDPKRRFVNRLKQILRKPSVETPASTLSDVESYESPHRRLSLLLRATSPGRTSKETMKQFDNED